MINGTDPIIIFHIYNKPERSVFGPLSEFDQRLDDIRSLIGIPIVIPLNERLTGIYIDNESRTISVATNVDPSTGKDPLTNETLEPNVIQVGAESSVNVAMKAKNDSIMLTVFLAVAELIVSKLVSAEYGITYLNGSTVIFNGLLSSLTTNIDRGTDLMRIDLSLSTAKKTPPALPKAAPPGPAPIPNTGGSSLGPGR